MAHRYGALENHVNETGAQEITRYELKALTNETMEDTEAMSNFIRTNLTLYQSLTQ